MNTINLMIQLRCIYLLVLLITFYVKYEAFTDFIKKTKQN